VRSLSGAARGFLFLFKLFLCFSLASALDAVLL
jgi:hypothetical protein